MDRKTLIQLRTLLADMYPDIESARVVATDAGLNPSRIAFDSRATLNWSAILSEAEKTNCIDALLEIVAIDYGDNPTFQTFYETYMGTAATSTAKPATSKPLTPVALSRPLTGQQFQQLHKALLTSFNQSELERLVMFELNENMNAIAGGSNLIDIVFDLIRWAERQGRTADLLRAAVNARRNSQELLDLQRELLG